MKEIFSLVDSEFLGFVKLLNAAGPRNIGKMLLLYESDLM
jgi:hypothetical protein